MLLAGKLKDGIWFTFKFNQNPIIILEFQLFLTIIEWINFYIIHL